MTSVIKKIINMTALNGCLFFILIIGIQNSSNKSKVNFIFNESVKLPISFIVGTSFISGSIFGSLICLSFDRKKDKNQN